MPVPSRPSWPTSSAATVPAGNGISSDGATARLGYDERDGRACRVTPAFHEPPHSRVLRPLPHGLIFAGPVGTAVIASRLLLVAGVHSLMIRYALTVVGAYAVFFVLIRAWIAYVTRTAASDPGLDLPDVAPGGGGGPGGGGEFQPGGGQFGGGGASGGYDDPGEAPVFRSVAEAGGRGGGSMGAVPAVGEEVTGSRSTSTWTRAFSSSRSYCWCQ